METQYLRLEPTLVGRLRRPVASPLVLWLTLTLWVTAAPTVMRAAASVRLHSEARMLEILHAERTLLTYTFATNQFKPYVRELITLDGVDLLRDAPADHLHHHGLMYAIKVNGINFWEEAPQAGRQVPQAELIREVRKDPAGRPQARFTQVVHWVEAGHATAPDTEPFALLIEERTITITTDPTTELIQLEWESEFTVGAGAPEVVLTGSSYHGLGIRFREEFDGVAERYNSEKLAYPDEGREGVLPTRWMAVSHVVAGRPYTLVLFNHPSNPGQPRFFSMQKPFAYLSATQGLDEAPLKYRTGDRWKLRYLLLASPRRMAAEQLDRQYDLFIRP
jgi:hypothetical protein